MGIISGTLHDYIQSAKSVTDYTVDGKCSGCGSCCSVLLAMSNEEINRIKRFIRKHRIKEQKHIMPTVDPVADLTCPFLDISKPDKKCTIYRVRPAICRCFICNDMDGCKNHFRQLYGQRRVVINVRETFYGDNKC